MSSDGMIDQLSVLTEDLDMSCSAASSPLPDSSTVHVHVRDIHLPVTFLDVL